MPAGRRTVGVMFAPERPLGGLLGFAQQAESAGLDELWLAEDCFLHGGLTAATAVLAQTARLSVGVGLLPTMVRNAAVAAMEIATVASLFPERLQVGFGHGVESWMRQIDARPADRMTALREVVVSVRDLLRGGLVDLEGRDVTLHQVRLDHPPAHPPPVLVGTTGPRGIALAGEVSDGLILPEGTGPAMLRSVAQDLPPGCAIVVYAWFRVDADGGRARDAVLSDLTVWRDMGLYPALAAAARVPTTGPIGRDVVDRLAVAGTASECAGSIRALHQAGATSVVLRPVGPDLDGQLRIVGRDVLPALTSRGRG